jgi:DNA invertase Pin-like site-specific DNA recombinase
MAKRLGKPGTSRTARTETTAMRAAIYARVSTVDQEPENQLQELRRYVEARGWTGREYVDRGVSGATDRRPAMDALVFDAKRRRVDVLVCWRLDRLGRNLRHLVTLIDELTALGIGFASLGEGIDTATPAGRLQLHILAALAEFERARIQERVRAGLARARAQGVRLGRPRASVPVARLQDVGGLTVDAAARALGVSRSTVKRWRRQVQQSPAASHDFRP